MKTCYSIVLKVMQRTLHWEELKSTWKFVGAIQEHWTMIDETSNYKSGTNGLSKVIYY